VRADSFGWIATDLRVSVTDRCNLRCSYCISPEGLDWLPPLPPFAAQGGRPVSRR
jgi:cyclic pyranopterin phosphate synthase